MSTVAKDLWQEAGSQYGGYRVKDLLKSATHDEINYRNEMKDRDTVLIRASEKGAEDVVNLLVGAGADLDAQNDWGNTALAKACNNGREGVVKLLIKAGADVDLPTKSGNTALMLAVNKGNKDIAKLLVDAGADKLLRNNEGKTALDLAKTRELMHLLGGNYVPPPQPTQTGENRDRPAAKKPAPTAPAAPLPTDALSLLEGDCQRFLQQVAGAQLRKDLMTREAPLLAQIDTAVAAFDFELVGTLGQQHKILRQESTRLPLSEEDYLKLPARHAELVQRLVDKGKQLMEAEDFASLERVGAALETLKGVAFPVRTDTGGKAAKLVKPLLKSEIDTLRRTSAELRSQCALLIKQAAAIPQRREMNDRLKEQQKLYDDATAAAQYDTAGSAAQHFMQIASLGKGLKVLKEKSAQLPLSEEDYLALPTRHATVVRKVVDMCMELIRAEEYTELTALGAQLTALKTLNLGTLAGAKDEVLGGEEDNAYDPVMPAGK